MLILCENRAKFEYFEELSGKRGFANLNKLAETFPNESKRRSIECFQLTHFSKFNDSEKFRHFKN